MTPATFKYHAFISYSHSDRVWANWLHRALETYRVPKRLVAAGAPARLSPIFRDREELPSANNLGQKIEEALLASRCFIVICSPRAAQSRWVNEEIARFKAMGRGDQTYCLIVEGEPPDCFPPALLAGDGAEPIAADVRDGGDGKNQAKLKIIAGMLGVGLDELRQRDLQRRNRRLVWFSTASIAGVLVTTALAAFAWIARNEAEASRLKAQQEAETARQTTQFMVGLFSVVDPSEARGRSITANEILEKGVANIHRDLAGQPEVQATMLQTMGKVFTGLGLFPRSAELLRDALTLEGAAPSPATEIALADALFNQGEYGAAEQRYRETFDALSQQPWSDARSGAANGLADVLTQNGEYPAAIQMYKDTLDRDIATWGEIDGHVARTANGLATAQLYFGDTDDAGASYGRALKAYRDALGTDHPKVAETISNLGAVRYQQGDIATAAQYWSDALPLFRKVYGPLHPEVAGILNNLGRAELELRRVDALALLAESVDIERKLGRSDHDDFVFALNSLALAYQYRGDLQAAEPLFSEAAALAARYDHRMWGPILANEADLQCVSGRTQDSTALLDEAAARTRKSYPDEPWLLAIVDSVRGQCLSASGQSQAAEKLLLDSLPVIEARFGKNSLFTYDARTRIARHYERAGKTALAQDYRAG